MTAVNALDLIDAAIADLEAKLNLAPGQSLSSGSANTSGGSTSKNTKEEKPNNHKTSSNDSKKSSSKQSTKNKTITTQNNNNNNTLNPNTQDQPDICKLEFKVGKIIKAWVHPDADKLYCEEIDVGEETPRLIASGLRKHYNLEEMQGRRVVVVSNLKTKKLAGFASFGMVLCAASQQEEGEGSDEKVEFIEPPEGAVIGEVINFQGLPPPQPWSGAQVEKKKIFQTCAEGMRTTEEGLAAWNGHLFMTSGGPCTCATIRNGAMR